MSTPEQRADEAMREVWKQWFQFYTNSFRASGVSISMADQQAFYEIAQPIMRNLVRTIDLPPGYRIGPLYDTEEVKAQFREWSNQGERIQRLESLVARAVAATLRKDTEQEGSCRRELIEVYTELMKKEGA